MLLRPADVLLLGAALVAVLFFIGGLVDVFGVPVSSHRRRRRKPVRRRRKRGHPGRVEVHPAPSGESIEHTGSGSGLLLGRVAARLSSRSLNLAASAILLALILGIIVFHDGGTVSVQPRPAPRGLSLAEQAGALAARGDYEGAWGLYSRALQAAPEDVRLWYALGVTLSHLNQRKETEEAFRYVVHRGRPDSEEARLARRWLVSAGVLAGTVASVSSPGTESQAGSAEGASSQPLSLAAPTVAGTLRGRTGAGTGTRLIQVALEGAEDSNREIAFAKSLKEGESYEFADVPPGKYRLKAQDPDSEAPLWDVPVTVTVGKETALGPDRRDQSGLR